MSRNIDATLAAGLANANIEPIILAALTFASGVTYLWSGVGDLTWNGNTYKGVGALGSISAITEGSSIQADGMTVTLNGISAGIPLTPSGVTPPVTIPAGQYVVWALPKASSTSPGYDAPSTPWGPISATATATSNGTGTLTMTGSTSLGTGDTYISAQWSGFEVPAALPADAVIQQIIPVLLASGLAEDVAHQVYCGVGDASGPTTFLSVSGAYSGQFSPGSGSPYSLGTTTAAITGAYVGADLNDTGDGSGYPDYMNISFAALAIYYTSASGQPGTLLSESLGDIQIGAPAQIYIGLMQNGAILGTPYLAFAGLVDQPSVKVGPDTLSISLALENRLSNLQRANQRRYTAADQQLTYPDDTAFNFVEMLNDEALRWGS